MANKMREERNKLVEMKSSGITCNNMEWLYPRVMEKFSAIALYNICSFLY